MLTSLVLLSLQVVAAAKQCDITSYGAKASLDDNSHAIQKAVKDCKSGGEIVVPAGTFKTLPLAISGVKKFTMTLAAGSSLQGVTREKWPINEKGDTYATFLDFQDCDQCTLRGEGMLDGQGVQWYKDTKDKKLSYNRPRFLEFNGGSQIKVLDIKLLNAPKFNMALNRVKGAEIAGINITNEHVYGEPPNTDGIDPGHDSQDIWIHNVHISNGDDSIAVKPGTEAGGCTRNILVENSNFEHGHGLSIGSIGEGCIKDVVFRNNTISEQSSACRIKTFSDGPGYVKNITWQDITITNTQNCIKVYNYVKSHHPPNKNNVEVSDIKFINVKSSTCQREDAVFTCPPKAPCKGIKLDHVQVSGGPGMVCENAFGSSTHSIKSCLQSGPTPAPPGPTPAPPGPTPAPLSCDVDGCLKRCEEKYHGQVAEKGDAYNCAKGCAGMSAGKVSDRDKFCKVAADKREEVCKDHCSHASSGATNVEICKVGCQFWGVSWTVAV